MKVSSFAIFKISKNFCISGIRLVSYIRDLKKISLARNDCKFWWSFAKIFPISFFRTFLLSPEAIHKPTSSLKKLHNKNFQKKL